MWKQLVIVLPILALASSFVLEPEDEMVSQFKRARSLLTQEQENLLIELAAMDDAMIASSLDQATGRGIVDDILQALAGVGSGTISVNILGSGTNGNQNPQQPIPPTILNPTITFHTAPAPAAPAPAAVPLPATVSVGIAPAPVQPQPQSLPVTVQSDVSKSLVNSSDAAPQADLPAPTGAPIPGFPSFDQNQQPKQAPAAAPQQQQQRQNVTAIGGNNNHLFSTISSVIINSNRRNVTGIVDESLRIATPAPIREFVTGILNVVYCNSIRRLLGRC